ncbi:uncharacterized protein BO66DRAFT_159187 [Aspergillus aculeatinus CBS 121060]|uniref:Uncharacterized protein n=1 Tax=Aspergillus aculeatinus CBS 121060 TaxID=1448322 RepID=A0ACD1H088_9EURO|nr:hypothetical protein BO66DRAFT_159187 [Aspergillus aculeatinus CBS 121060]RAH67157.1 hypothetical protein BO66DRAFT_159187 [Aspergillus aculeatinus CBS 121060]
MGKSGNSRRRWIEGAGEAKNTFMNRWKKRKGKEKRGREREQLPALAVGSRDEEAAAAAAAAQRPHQNTNTAQSHPLHHGIERFARQAGRQAGKHLQHSISQNVSLPQPLRLSSALRLYPFPLPTVSSTSPPISYPRSFATPPIGATLASA